MYGCGLALCFEDAWLATLYSFVSSHSHAFIKHILVPKQAVKKFHSRQGEPARFKTAPLHFEDAQTKVLIHWQMA